MVLLMCVLSYDTKEQIHSSDYSDSKPSLNLDSVVEAPTLPKMSGLNDLQTALVVGSSLPHHDM